MRKSLHSAVLASCLLLVGCGDSSNEVPNVAKERFETAQRQTEIRRLRDKLRRICQRLPYKYIKDDELCSLLAGYGPGTYPKMDYPENPEKEIIKLQNEISKRIPRAEVFE